MLKSSVVATGLLRELLECEEALEGAELVDEQAELEEKADVDDALEELWDSAALPDIVVAPG